MPKVRKATPDDEVNFEKCESEMKDLWEQDIQKRKYYYDDSHGYETYLPEDEDQKESGDSE